MRAFYLLGGAAIALVGVYVAISVALRRYRIEQRRDPERRNGGGKRWRG
jgi:hypothetical protein